MVRRDRVRGLLWIGGLVGLVSATAVSINGLYETPQDLQSYADLATSDVALKALAGPGYGLDNPTLGAVLMNEVLVYSLVAIALMSVFMLVRHTRAEEETDRAELVRAAPVGRFAILAAASTWVSVIAVVAAAGMSAVLFLFELEVAGVMAFGAVTTAVGVTFVGVAAVAGQVASSARSATAGASAMLGLSFVLRAVGDLGSGWATWLSPLGWAQSIRAFGSERWWVLGLLVAASLALAAASIALSRHRDLGAGFLKPRPGPAEGSARLASPLALALRLTRTSIISWTIGLALTGFFFGLVADLADEILENEAMADFIAQAGIGTPAEAFLAYVAVILALMGSGFAVSTVLRLRTEETAERAGPVLAGPVSRRQWSFSYLVVAIGGAFVAMTVCGLTTGIGSALSSGDAGEILPALGATLVMVPAIAVLAAVTFALFGLRSGFAPLGWAGLALSVIVALLSETLNLPQWVRNASPFEHVPALPAANFTGMPVAILVAVAVGTSFAGLMTVDKRDIARSR